MAGGLGGFSRPTGHQSSHSPGGLCRPGGLVMTKVLVVYGRLRGLKIGDRPPNGRGVASPRVGGPSRPGRHGRGRGRARRGRVRCRQCGVHGSLAQGADRVPRERPDIAPSEGGSGSSAAVRCPARRAARARTTRSPMRSVPRLGQGAAAARRSRSSPHRLAHATIGSSSADQPGRPTAVVPGTRRPDAADLERACSRTAGFRQLAGHRCVGLRDRRGDGVAGRARLTCSRVGYRDAVVREFVPPTSPTRDPR